VIRFEKKAASEPVLKEAENNRFDQIREAAAEGHKKSTADGTRRAAPAKKDDRLI
jgi:hypothetical protein